MSTTKGEESTPASEEAATGHPPTPNIEHSPHPSAADAPTLPVVAATPRVPSVATGGPSAAPSAAPSVAPSPTLSIAQSPAPSVHIHPPTPAPPAHAQSPALSAAASPALSVAQSPAPSVHIHPPAPAPPAYVHPPAPTAVPVPPTHIHPPMPTPVYSPGNSDITTPSYLITPDNVHSPFPRLYTPRGPNPPPSPASLAPPPPPGATPPPSDPNQRRRHLTNDERIRVRTLFFDAKFNKKQIQRLTQYGLNQIRTAIASPTVGKRSGRPTNMTPAQDKVLLEFVGASRENATMSYQKIADTVLDGEFGIYTIRNAFRRLGYQRVNGLLRPAPKPRRKADGPGEVVEGDGPTWNKGGQCRPSGYSAAGAAAAAAKAARRAALDGLRPEELAVQALGRTMAGEPTGGTAAGSPEVEDDDVPSEDDEDEDEEMEDDEVVEQGARGDNVEREGSAGVAA